MTHVHCSHDRTHFDQSIIFASHAQKIYIFFKYTLKLCCICYYTPALIWRHTVCIIVYVQRPRTPSRKLWRETNESVPPIVRN